MTLSRRDVSLGALAGFALAGMTGCSRRDGTTGKVLTFAQPMEPTALNMAITSAAPGNFICTKVYEGLLDYDIDGNPLPGLATDWDVSPDGLTYRFALRPDVRWHDGAPFTAKDVAFSIMNAWKKYHSRGRTVFAHAEAVEASAPLTAVLRLSRPAPYILKTLQVSEYPVLPAHLFEGTDIRSNPYNLKPVGTGPFRFVRWDRGEQITLERNLDYWDRPRPHLDRIVARFLPDATATVTALETGTIDLGIVPPAEVARLRQAGRIDVVNAAPTLLSYFNIEFNLDRPYFRDVRVRHAVAHAIDRQFLAKHIVGDAVVATGIIPPGIREFHESGLPDYPFDLARARSLLDEAGLKPGADGVRLRIFLDSATGASHIRIGGALRSMMAQAGIALQPRVADQGEYINRVYSRRDFDLSMTGGGTGADPAIGIQRLYWSKNIIKGVAFSNGSGYSNPMVDRLLEAAQAELDPAKRKQYYRQFQQIAMAELPIIPVYWTDGGYLGVNRKIKDLNLGRFGVNAALADASA
ncbi:MAG: ABC transporter substrate-binding protein [Sphingobium sp.]